MWDYWLQASYVGLLVKKVKTGYVELLVTNWLCGITGYKLVVWNYWLQTGYVELLVTNWLCGITC